MERLLVIVTGILAAVSAVLATTIILVVEHTQTPATVTLPPVTVTVTQTITRQTTTTTTVTATQTTTVTHTSCPQTTTSPGTLAVIAARILVAPDYNDLDTDGKTDEQVAILELTLVNNSDNPVQVYRAKLGTVQGTIPGAPVTVPPQATANITAYFFVQPPPGPVQFTLETSTGTITGTATPAYP